MKFGRETLGLKKVVAITTEDNVASQKLLKKLGFGFKSYINEPETNEKLSLYSSDVGNG